ncbi:ABC transporter ATP-binding protein/permease [Rhodospirillales bacterium]|nr:ABC transporter ATP-binding protein/permease [Rhodospirillales bacterium]
MLQLTKMILFLIAPATRLSACALALLMVIGAIIEAVGIGLILPLVTIITQPEVLSTNSWALRVFGEIGPDDYNRILILLMSAFLATIILKNATLLALYVLQGHFFAKNEALLARRIFIRYIYGNFNLHLTRNSADLINNVTSTASSVFSHAMRGLMILLSESILILFITIFLFYINPVITMVAICGFLVCAAAMHFAVRTRLVHWGMTQTKIRQKLLKLLTQSFHSIKEVKISGREDYLVSEFSAARKLMAEIDARMFVIGTIPRLWVETLFISSIVISIVYVLTSGNPSGKFFSILAVFLVAAIRLMPSVARILMAFNTIRGGTYPVETIYNDLNDQSSIDSDAAQDLVDVSKITFNHQIELENISFSYPNMETAAAHDINLTIKKGESIGLVGPSGAGKTTLADLILGLIKPTSGCIRVDGDDVTSHTRIWQKSLSYVPQSVYLFDASIRKNVAFNIPEDEIDDDKVWASLEVAQLASVVRGLPDGLDTLSGDRGTRLSGGQKQRIGIARAVYNDLDVLILDEATSSLDSQAEFEVSQAIEHLSSTKTMIIIAHRLSTLRKCDRLVYIDGGRIIDSGNFEELYEKNIVFKNLVELSRF